MPKPKQRLATDLAKALGEAREGKGRVKRLKMELPPNLKVGDRLLVELDDCGDYTGEWIEATVTGISVGHHFRAKGILHPYIYVALDHPRLNAINYSLYCATDHVKFPVAGPACRVLKRTVKLANHGKG